MANDDNDNYLYFRSIKVKEFNIFSYSTLIKYKIYTIQIQIIKDIKIILEKIKQQLYTK